MAENSTEGLSGRSEDIRPNPPKTFTRLDVVRFSESSPREPYLSFTTGPHPLRRLIIQIWSHDEGWYNQDCENYDPYANSQTSFALGIVPEGSDLCSSSDDLYLCEIHRNIRASTDTKCHILEWRLNTPFEGDQSDEIEAQGWLESISNGCCVDIGVFPFAENSSWLNVVHKVTVQLYDETTTARFSGMGPAGEEAASQMTDTTEAEADTESIVSLTGQTDKVQDIAQIPSHDPNDLAELIEWVTILGQQLKQKRSLQDLTEAIIWIQVAIEIMPDNHPDFAPFLINLGIWLSMRHDFTQSMDDLTGAIEVLEEATKVTPGENPDLAIHFSLLSHLLRRRYERTESLPDLTRSIEVEEREGQLIHDGHPRQNEYLKRFAMDLCRRWTHTRSVLDLTKAIEMQQRAVEATSDDDPELPVSQYNLAKSLRTLYKETGRVDDLERAIEVLERVVKTAPGSHPNRAWFLNTLGISLELRFETTGSMDDLERAIEMIEEAIDATPEADHRSLAKSLINLGICLGHRSEQENSAGELDMAIESTERAIGMMPEDHPNLATAYNNLGRWLSRRYNQKQSIDSIARAIEASQKAIALTGNDSSDRALYFGTLSYGLIKRYEQNGSVDDLTRAIEAIQQAIGATPNGNPNLPTLFSNLASYLSRRHELIGLADDRTKAIEAAEEAAEAIPHDHISRAGILTNLGTHLRTRYRRTGAMDDLMRAIQVSQQAVETSDAAGLASRLCNLGLALRERYKRTGSMDDLMRAIEEVEMAIEMARDDRDLASYLINLAMMLYDRYDRTGSMEDLARAIEVAQKSVEAMDQDHIHLSRNIVTLGDLLGRRYAQTREKTDQDAQLSAYVRAWHCTTSALSDRIRPAISAAVIYASREEWHKAYGMLRNAVLLLPKISLRSLRQSDMQEMLSPTSGLATGAAATALNAGKPVLEVLSILEMGRGVIAGLLIDTRGDLSDLRETHPSLAEKFDALRKELDSPAQNNDSVAKLSIANRDFPSQNSSSITELSMVDRRHQASLEFDEVIGQIRAQDVFHNFLQPPPSASLMTAAEAGPVVVINVSEYRCDAILVERNTVQLLQLPDLSWDDAVEYATSISYSKHNPWPLLEWLWTTVCRPCLDALRLTEPLGEGDRELPHVWWVPTGPLSDLPLHAAGIYTKESKETVLDRVVSSYASSLKSLQHGRRRRVGMIGEQGQQKDAILVAMEQTEGQTSLPNAKTETDKVRALCPSLHLNATTPLRLKGDILEHLRNCKVLHFAGHGESKIDPSQSCLLLDDWKTDPLTVGDLRQSWLQESPAFLAYLSACSTGSNQGRGLSDEAIHLVSAFQLAGFRHVVGTLWEVSDPHCVDVASVLYETLRDEGMTDQAVSYGLHRAVRKLRDESFRKGSKRDVVLVEDEEPTILSGINTFWIPYVHFGA